MGIPGKGLTTIMDISTKILNKTQKARFSISEITNQYLRKLLNNFKNPPYLAMYFHSFLWWKWTESGDITTQRTEKTAFFVLKKKVKSK